jgi:hypothetical protein
MMVNKFIYKEQLTKAQRGFIEHWKANNPKPVKEKKKVVYNHDYYNPNDLIHISPQELERQSVENLEQQKREDKWHSQNVEANKLPTIQND